MPRPEPPPLRADDDGYHWEAQIAPRWRIYGGVLLCRWTDQGHRCRALAAMQVNRGSPTRGAPRYMWWAYCQPHAYGRWIEDGQVYEWILVADEETRR